MIILASMISFILGGMFGVFIMCLFQIGRRERDDEDGLSNDRNGGNSCM